MYHGIINVYKEKGFTSHDVVAKLRGIAGQKKIGHTGTLDPDAVGVLPVCLGAATRLCDMLTDKSKEYEAVLRLGVVTDTQDISGTVLETHPVTADADAVEAAIQSFVGKYDQIPPMYSAIKVNGKKLYELAREGKEVERKARPVEIHYIVIEKPFDPVTGEVKMRVGCSKGTYIRTLCHDIGAKLGCGGTMAYLCRTRVGQFTLDKAYTLSKLQEMKEQGTLEKAVTPVETFFAYLPRVVVNAYGKKLVENGNVLSENVLEQTAQTPENAFEMGPAETEEKDITESPVEEKNWVRVYDSENRFYGIYKYVEKEKLYKPEKMFFMQ